MAELMIVLSVIGVLTAILLPSARNAMPDSDVMKFMKNHKMLFEAIRELANSEEYYGENLSKKPNGSLVDSPTYFCSTLADILNPKSLNCKSRLHSIDPGVHINADWGYGLETNKGSLDRQCKLYAPEDGDEIIMPDGVTIYLTSPGNYFGHSSATQFDTYRNSDGLRVLHKVLCMDIDGTPEEATDTDCVNECPFGYGLRIDGQMLSGVKADEWLKKSVQGND
ncbi:MAG: type II secretion system protein [Candidatus Gastranaerophilales bacterium]|nr:type II secretion system protein [Candidatus Gastranaerophilales bacterium]